MKVFISHKKEDSSLAIEVKTTLKALGVNAYLDILEGNLLMSSEELTKHIRSRLNACTDLLVVLSENTKKSWWVPFEIGMAAQKDLPTVNYLKSGIQLPDYLDYWPRLKNTSDLRKYVETKESIQKSLNEKYAFTESQTARFYKELKQKL